MPATSSRMSASSSMIRMSKAILLSARRLVDCVQDGFRRFGGEHQPHPGAALARKSFRGIVKLDPSAMLFENLADNGEPEAGALLAGGDIGLKQPAAIFLWQADAVVDHVDDNVVAVALRRHHDPAAPDLAGRHRGDRLAGVLYDIGQALRDEPAVEPRPHRV